MDLTRDHADSLADMLPPLALDRQRIVHAAAFRRLQLKTQVFLSGGGDHFRTRLTHTLEVAHQARCIAAALGLNVELAEVVALAHDLGHPPFGHAGEAALDACVRAGAKEADGPAAGFEHNAQTLRIVEELEHPYPEFRGLNLTRVVRECLVKHSTRYDRPGTHPLRDGQPPPAEGLVVDLADRLAYALHDLQDGLHAGLLAPQELAGLALWRAAYTGPAPDGERRDDLFRNLRPAVDRMQALLMEGLRAGGAPRLTAEGETQLAELERWLDEKLYHHPTVAAADNQARRTLSEVFTRLVGRPERLPARFAQRVAQQGAARVVVDYVAGMTDRFCLEQHARLVRPPLAPRRGPEGPRRGPTPRRERGRGG